MEGHIRKNLLLFNQYFGLPTDLTCIAIFVDFSRSLDGIVAAQGDQIQFVRLTLVDVA